MKWALAAACVYEAGSIIGGRTPTFTEMCAEHEWLAPAILVALAIHLRPRPRRCVHDLT